MVTKLILNIIISVPPQGAEIQGPLQPFTCSRGYFISCKVWGSNPAARIEWFRGTSPNHGLRPLKAHNQTVTEGGNVTISWLHYRPKPSHHHQTLICRGSNDELMTANSHTVEDYHRLEIFCEYRHHSLCLKNPKKFSLLLVWVGLLWKPLVICFCSFKNSFRFYQILGNLKEFTRAKKIHQRSFGK